MTEAQHNELLVRAEGALYGERRAAIGRLVMIMLFGLVASARSGAANVPQLAVGTAFSVYSIVVLYFVWRRVKPDPLRAIWGPVILTVIDFVGTGTLGVLEIRFRHGSTGAEPAIAAAILMAFSVARFSVWHVVLSCVCALISVPALMLYAGNIETHVVLFVASGNVVLGVTLALANRANARMFRDLRQRDILARFLPAQIAERVLAEGPTALAPTQRAVTVLFSDIRGFTTMSEHMDPSSVLAMLDDYFARMSGVVKRRSGVVGKFLGDGMLAFWGAPDPTSDHAALAALAARDMLDVVGELNQERAAAGEPPIKIGIGLHTGTVAAGMLGGALQAEYTIIGDAVNVASRIEGLTKEHAVDVLLSETTQRALGDELATRKVADVAIRGRAQPITLYTLEAHV